MNIPKTLTMDFFVGIKKYDLQCVPNYLEGYFGREWLIFEDTAKFTSLDIDALSEQKYSYILFEKDLIVDGAITQNNYDSGPIFVVKGNVYAKNASFGGALVFILGDVNIQQTMIGIYNHGTIEIKGNVHAEIVISDDHAISINGQNNQYVFFDSNCCDSVSEYSVQDLLKGQYYDLVEERIDVEKVLNAIKQGNSIKKTRHVNTKLQKAIEKFKQSKNGKLNLSNLNLEIIPDDVFELSDIYEINLSNNRIKALPSKISHLSKLKKIDLSGCLLDDFPLELLTLINLEFLDLSCNYISSLPDDLELLVNIKTLNLYQCDFISFPRIIYRLPKLEFLDMENQGGDATLIIDHTIPNLKKLILRNNASINIVAEQPKLKELDIKACSLKELPITITECVNLTKLDFSYNHNIKALPENFSSLTKLKELSFSMLCLEEKDIAGLKKLSKLESIKILFNYDNYLVHQQVISSLLSLDSWYCLEIDCMPEDQSLIDAIILRPNLKKLIIKGEAINIKEARQCLGV